MVTRWQALARVWALFVCCSLLVSWAVRLDAAPYAAMVMDARSGEVLHSRNADTRLHPASLTKMMTLYIAFEAVERGELSMDSLVRITKKAAAEPPSKLGLRTGQKIALRYLVRAAAVKSANDAATAIGVAISGSEAAFARRMNRTAKALGMSRTTFKNAHGLTESGHLSTARDMTTMGRRLFYDFPDYYNIFSRRSTDTQMRMVNNTNRRLLAAYKGADGIKTGFTNAAGFNLVASAERGCERIIATVFGGRSTATRNAKVAELLDLGFHRTKGCANAPRFAKPVYQAQPGAKKPIEIAQTRRPSPRPVLAVAPSAIEVAEAAPNPVDVSRAVAEAVSVGTAPQPQPQPQPRPGELADQLQVVTRLSTAGGRHWGINLGRFGSRHQAESILLKTALIELNTLDEALRRVVPRGGGYDANFVGMTEESAALACRRLAARNMSCDTVKPNG